MRIHFDHCRSIGDEERDWLCDALPLLGLLADVIPWGLSLSPPAVVSAVLVQDEYTHDVVMEIGEGLVLVFDTT